MRRIVGARLPSSRGYVWGIFDQGFVSLSNFLLSLAVGRRFGAEQLGIVFIGFSVFLVFLGLFRAMVTEPVVTISTSASEDSSSTATRAGFGLAVLLGLFLSGASAVVGLVFRDAVMGEALLMFAPWFLPALVHDFSRGALFRDRRASVASLGSAFSFVSMCLVLAIVWRAPSAAMYVGAWGFGLGVACAWGVCQVGLWPGRSRDSLRWWIRNAWPMARWFGLGSAVSILGTHLMPVALVTVLATTQLGGLRAIQSLFAPLSLISPAISLPGLPRLVRDSAASFPMARRSAYQMSFIAAVLCAVCLALFMLLGSTLLSLVYGDEFTGFLDLILPVGIQQVLIASLIGPILLLKAHRRGRDLLWISVVLSSASLALTLPLASIATAQGATWGLALGSLGGFATTMFLMERFCGQMTESRDL